MHFVMPTNGGITVCISAFLYQLTDSRGKEHCSHVAVPTSQPVLFLWSQPTNDLLLIHAAAIGTETTPISFE